MVRKDDGVITTKSQLRDETAKEVRDVAKKKLADKQKKGGKYKHSQSMPDPHELEELEPLNENANNNAARQQQFRENNIPFADDDTVQDLSYIRPPPDDIPSSTQSPSSYTQHLSPQRKGQYDDRVCLNISGMKYETWRSTLERFPHTLLGSRQRRLKYYDSKNDEYFFDRHRPSFDAILYFYQSWGRLERPANVPVDIFSQEIKFFELGKDIYERFRKEEGYVKPEEPLMPENKLQRQIWCLFEHPETSVFARMIAVFSITVILLSIVSFCVETLPAFRNKYDPVLTENVTLSASDTLHAQLKNPFFIIETFCIIWFTIELLTRWITCPAKCAFWKSVLNIIDLVAILPYFITLIVDLVQSDASGDGVSLAILRVLRLIRVFRIFKLSRHSEGLKVLGLTLRGSIKELAMLTFFLVIGVILFASAAFFAEMDENEAGYASIPHSFWWAIITMTTVGYGDVSPITGFGRVVGSLAGIAGVLTIALPVPVIVSNFNYYYHRQVDDTGAIGVENIMNKILSRQDWGIFYDYPESLSKPEEKKPLETEVRLEAYGTDDITAV